MTAIAAKSIQIMKEFIPLELTNFAWAFATLAVRDTPMLQCIAAESLLRMHEFQPYNVSIIVWAVARL